MYTIRKVRIDDVKRLLEIYEQYIDSSITFECHLPTTQEFKDRIETFSAEYPYLVCEDEGRVVAYAYAHKLFEREAYQWNAELSIYIDQSCTGHGIGKRMYEELIRVLQEMGVKKVYGIVTIPNEPSERLHESLGFQRVWVHEHGGYKNDSWHDVAWFEKNIGTFEESPKPVR